MSYDPRTPDALRPVRLALYVFCLLLPFLGCMARRADPPLRPSPAAEDALTEGETPVVVRPPAKPLEWMKVPPCDSDMGEVAINGACYVELAKRPPCGRLVEHAKSCYRAIAKTPRQPTSIHH
jgi:hypothetical protein